MTISVGRMVGRFFKPLSLIRGFAKPRLGYHAKEFLRGASSSTTRGKTMLFISLLFIILFLFIQPPVEVLRMFSSKPFKHILTVLYRVAFLPKTVTTVISLTGFNTHEYRHYQEQNGTTNSTKEPKHPLVAPRFKFVQRLFVDCCIN